MKVKEVLSKLHQDGWYDFPGKPTSHIQLKHPTKPGKVTVANHPGDVAPFTLKSIEKQSRLHF
jgi:predicted RNA binding protein YcfA (HicA-like mRNA interferase family)